MLNINQIDLYACVYVYNSNLRYELESVVAELVVSAVEEPLGDAAEWGVLLDQSLYICDII